MKTKDIFVACDVSSQKEIMDLLSKIHEQNIEDIKKLRDKSIILILIV